MTDINFGGLSPSLNLDYDKVFAMASAEAQVEYLLKVNRLQSEEISDLKLRLRTVELDDQIRTNDMKNMLNGLDKTRQWLRNQKPNFAPDVSPPTPKRSKILGWFPFSNKRSVVLRISCFAVAAFLLGLSLRVILAR